VAVVKLAQSNVLPAVGVKFPQEVCGAGGETLSALKSMSIAAAVQAASAALCAVWR
jgi:hypothetical protein